MNKEKRKDEVEFNLDRDSSDEEIDQIDDAEYVYVTERSESCHSDEEEFMI